jgi:Uma2 family endonuclease
VSTVQIPEEQRLRLSLIPWETYVAYSDGLGPRHIRVTYDRGEMENRKSRLRHLVDVLMEEMDIEVVSSGSMTCRREDLLRGLEPDESYWIEHEPQVRGREDIDLEMDPPPDLALEIEISRSTMNRMAIYAALRVPEAWRWDGETLSVHLLSARGTYRQSDRSKAFPFLPLGEFVEFLARTDLSEMQLVRSFRGWVRKRKKEEWRKKK